MQKKTGGIIGAIVAVITGVVLATHLHSPDKPIVPVFTPTAQAADDKIHVEGVSSGDAMLSTDWGVSRYNVTLPPHTGPLDMHQVTLIDDHKYEQLIQRSDAWPQPVPIAFRLDSNADDDVKAILQAQGLPVKDQRVTYHVGMGVDGSSTEEYETIAYRYGSGGYMDSSWQTTDSATIGQKIILSDIVRADKKQREIPNWQERGVLEKLPHGMAHRFTQYILFTPRTGPMRGKGRIASIGQDITRY